MGMAAVPPERAAGHEEWQRLCSGLLRGVREPAGLGRALAAVTAAAEAACGERPVACQAGCPACCVLNVAVLLPEAAVIAAWLAARAGPASRPALLERLDGQRRRVRWMTDEERIHRQVACSFLDPAGSCMIYPLRPLACRGVTSLDRDQCRAAFDPTEFDGPRAVPTDLVRRQAMEEAFRALAGALEEVAMDSRSIELSAGVAAFVAKPELGSDLLAGRRLPAGLWE